MTLLLSVSSLSAQSDRASIALSISPVDLRVQQTEAIQVTLTNSNPDSKTELRSGDRFRIVFDMLGSQVLDLPQTVRISSPRLNPADFSFARGEPLSPSARPIIRLKQR
jgi:hypothetical protein